MSGTKISALTSGTPASTDILPSATAAGGNKRFTVTQLFQNAPSTTLPVAAISATGTASNTTFLRGDGAWATPAASSGVSSLNTLTGALTLAAGSGVSITPGGGNTLTVAATGSSAGLAGVDTIAALKAASVSGVSGGDPIMVRGYYAAADGGGGLFLWNASSTATDNGGTIIQVTGVPTGRWIRFVPGGTMLDARWFGAKGDGTADDTAALNAWLTAGGGTLPPANAGQFYKITGTLLPPANSRIMGAGATSLIKLVLANGTAVVPAIDIRTAATDVTLDAFAVDHNAAALAQNTVYGGDPGASSCIIIQGDRCIYTRLRVSNAFGNGVYVAQYASPSGGYNTGEPQYCVGADCITVTCGLGNSTFAPKPGKNGIGIDISGSANVLSNCVDYMSYTGFAIETGNGSDCRIVNCTAFYTKIDTANPANGSGTGFFLGGSNSQITNCIAISPEGHGFWLDVGDWNQISNCLVRYAGGHGYAIKGSWNLSNCVAAFCSQSTLTDIAAFTPNSTGQPWNAFDVGPAPGASIAPSLDNCWAYGDSHQWGYSERNYTSTRLTTASTASGSNILTIDANFLTVGGKLSHPNIPAGTTIAAILSGTQLRMSANATGTIASGQSITFTSDITARSTGGSYYGAQGQGITTGSFSGGLYSGLGLRANTITTPTAFLDMITPNGVALQVGDQGANSVNYLFVKAAQSGGAVQLGAFPAGTDANIDLDIRAYGTSGKLTTAYRFVSTNATASTSTSTGALTVAGGVAIGNNLYVAGLGNIAGDLTVSGQITSSLVQAPASLLDLKTINGSVLKIEDNGASTTNWLIAKSNVGGAAAQLVGWGSGPAADLSLLPKGAGKVTAPTVATSDNSTAIATTAWVKAQGYGAASGAYTFTNNNRILGNIAGTSQAGQELTGTQTTALLDTFTSGAKGLAPASGGGTTNFLRADGTWAAPGGGASGPITSSGLTQNTNRLLGRTTASSGAIEEIQLSAPFVMASGSLSFIETTPAVSALSTLTIDGSNNGGGFIADAREIEITCYGLNFSTSASLTMQIQRNGTTWLTTADYMQMFWFGQGSSSAGAGGYNSGTATTSFSMSLGNSNTVGQNSFKSFLSTGKSGEFPQLTNIRRELRATSLTVSNMFTLTENGTLNANTFVAGTDYVSGVRFATSGGTFSAAYFRVRRLA